jgi:hypothetical protein
VRVALVTVSVTGPFPVPEAGDNVNQAALSLALQLKVPLPVLLIVRVWAPMAGGRGAVVTVNVTGTMTEEAPVALSITVPL